MEAFYGLKLQIPNLNSVILIRFPIRIDIEQFLSVLQNNYNDCIVILHDCNSPGAVNKAFENPQFKKISVSKDGTVFIWLNKELRNNFLNKINKLTNETINEINKMFG